VAFGTGFQHTYRPRQIVRTLTPFNIAAGARRLRPPGLGLTRRCHVTATTPTTEVAVVDPEFSDAERYALAAFRRRLPWLDRSRYVPLR
jgi:hypothetical protein